MCQLSEKIKFCTCKSKSTERLKNYWILYRYNPHKNEHIIGMPSINYNIDTYFELNSEMILKRLSEKDAFDKDFIFKNKDIFHLHISLKDDDFIEYTYEYKKGKWKITDYCPFTTFNLFDEKAFGKIKD